MDEVVDRGRIVRIHLADPDGGHGEQISSPPNDGTEHGKGTHAIVRRARRLVKLLREFGVRFRLRLVLVLLGPGVRRRKREQDGQNQSGESGGRERAKRVEWGHG